MCRSIAEAGDSTRRRCPIHRRDAVVAIHLAATESGLPQNVVEDLFTELRREGRHVSVSGLGGDNYTEVVTRIEEQFTDETSQRYRDIFNERDTDAPITSDTLFALARIRGASLSRARAVQERVDRVSRRSPRRSPAQVQSEYESLRREADINDPRYTPEAVAEAQENNLPAEVASVVALQSLEERIEAENAENAGPSRFDVEERPVERVSLRRTGSPFSEGVYDADGGVLELTFNQGTIYRYQNVPEAVWKELRDSEEVGLYFHDHIRGDTAYQYSNVTEAQDATSTVHCEGCGQFVPLDGSHICPSREDVPAPREHLAYEPHDSSTAIPSSLLQSDPNMEAVLNEGGGERTFSSISFARSAFPPRLMTTDATREELLADRDVLHDHMYLRSVEVIAPPAHLIVTSMHNAERVSFPVNFEGEYMTSGNLTLIHDSDGGVVADMSQMRCTCGRFVSTQTSCRHIETIARTAPTTLLDRSFTDELPARFGEPDSDVISAYRNETLVRNIGMNLIDDPESGFATLAEVRERFPEALELHLQRRRQEQVEEARQETALSTARQAEENELRRQGASYETIFRMRSIRDFYDSEPHMCEIHESYRESIKQRWGGADETHFDSVQAVKGKMEQYREQGFQALNTKTSGVTFGICDPNVPGSRRFGIELEFDLPIGPYKSEKLARIGQQLHEAGLTSSSAQEVYHAGARAGYRRWSFEQDATVDGEIVSPILDDSPESWTQVQKVIDIIKANGGRASVRAGSHVHISSSSYLDSTAKKAEVIRLTKEHEAILYRAAANPQRGKHRGTRWCRPNPEIQDTVRENQDRYIGDMSHEYGVNLESANGVRKSANIEIRLWDSTLDLATIQRQVAISAVLVDKAEHNVERDGESKPRNNSDNIPLRQEMHEDSGEKGIKKFLEDMIPTQAGREDVLQLISLNDWS